MKSDRLLASQDAEHDVSHDAPEKTTDRHEMNNF
jgi:hypothetical protein